MPAIKLQTRNGISNVQIEIADTADKRERGLMYRNNLDKDKGMWFVFDNEIPRAFWMKNTLIPLDILFFNGKKEVVRIIQNMEPCKTEQCPLYPSEQPAKYALEVPAGFVAENSVQIGDRIVEDK